MNPKKSGHLTGNLAESVNWLFQRVFSAASYLAVAVALFYWGPQLAAQPWFKSIAKKYADASQSILTKASRLRHDEEENAKLKLENTQLNVKLQSGHFDCALKGASDTTQKYEIKLSQETGNRVGKTLAAISYRIPDHLSPTQLFTLGLHFLKTHDVEKTAVVFTSLTGMEGNDSFKTSQNFLVTGISWYRLGNFLLADHYFDEALKINESSSNIQFQAQARLWKALVAKQLKSEEKSQSWLKELVDHHPNSVETGWINVSEGHHDKAAD
ncbi:MAG: hypothetical protein HYX41_06585 [Bdellovibrio sp.]|nr:hypothetical protein [Bdellovibrio sp.]